MPKEPSLQHLVYKSNYPFSIYLLFLLPVIFLLLSIKYELNLWGLLVYLPIFIVLFYIFFSRYSAKIEINDAFEMKIFYFFPWNKDITLNLHTFNRFDYARGFYDPFDDRRLGYLSFLRRCYDLLILLSSNRNIQNEFKVNLRVSAFKKIINILNKDIKIDLIKLKSSGNIIW